MNGMIERLDAIEKRYLELSEELMSPDIASDIKRMTALNKEQASLQEAYEAYVILKKVYEGIEEAKELANDRDPDIVEMAKMELADLLERKEVLEAEMQIILIEKDPNDEKNVIVEIRGAAGGDEGNIFAGDLYRMYAKYAETQGWKLQIMDSEEAEAGGFSIISFMVKGERVYSKLKFESGAHRVQRVPKTETQGRIHTSTATVLVMPEAEEVDIEINMSDLRIDTYRSSGAGGQHVNTTDSAIRITHIPTGVVASCQDGRSQHDNKDRAMQMLRTKLYEAMIREQEEKMGAERRGKIGTGDRSEKIRTYNYPQNRVTDHRIGFTIQQLDRVMEGKLDDIIEALLNEEQRLKLAGE